MLRIFAGAIALCLCTPAFAQDCRSIDAEIAKLKAQGDTIAGDVTFNGEHTDRIVVDVDADGIWIWPSKDGCIIVALPMPYDAVAPAVTPQSAPVLHGRGAEIGS